MTPLPAALGALLLLVAGCDGVIGDATESPGESPGRTGGTTDWTDVSPESCVDVAPTVPESPVRRLTAREYGLSVADVLGVDVGSVVSADDGRVGGFAVNRGASVGDLEIAQYAEAAEQIAESAEGTLSARAGCADATEDAACASAFLDTVGRGLFRRPLDAAERTRYLALFETARAELAEEREGALALMLRVMLQSPSFLYRGEVGREGAPGSVVQLSGPEVASRLSYLLWQSVPDAALLDAAAAGELDGTEGIEAHVRRMLDDPRAERSITEMHLRWLWLRTGPNDHRHDVSKLPELYPDYGPELLASMVASLEAFVTETVREGGTLENLLTSPAVWVDERLAPIVGVEHAGELAPVEAPAGERAGVLTHPLTIAVHSHPDSVAPIWPGQMIRAQLLCQPLPPPPPEIDTRLDRLSTPGCAGCHRMMDPIGFGFDSYDAIGRWRDPAVHDVDTRGEILDSDDADGPFVGAVELAERLADSDQVQRCYAEKWFVFALGREPTADEACALASAYARFEGSGGVIDELIVGIATSDAFRFYRAPEAVCE